MSLGSELFVSDLDRFLINPNLVVTTLGHAAMAEGLDEVELIKLASEAETRGESFDAWQYIESRYSLDQTKAIENRFIEQAKIEPIKYEDANVFLNYLDTNFIPNLILTMGNKKWQEIKLKAAGEDSRPYLITNQKSKGKIIRSWQNDQGLFVPPQEIIRVSAPRVNQGDDKKVSFEDFPWDYGKGILLQRPNERRLTSQSGDIDLRVIIVDSLLEIIEHLKTV